MTAIRGTLEVLLRKQREPAQYEEKISRVIGEVDRLNGMLDQLLQLARLESGKIPVNPSPVALNTLFGSLADKWQIRLQEKNMELYLQIPPASTVTTEAALLDIILDNMIGNAIKYTQEKGEVQIFAHSEDHQIILQVSDTGPGIPPEDQAHIFDKFYRGSNIFSDSEGSGLGLAIVKSIVDSQQGRIWVESVLGKGTSFFIVLPVTLPEARSAPVTSAE